MMGKAIRENFQQSTSFTLPINVISRALSYSGLSKDNYFQVLRMKVTIDNKTSIFTLCSSTVKIVNIAK